MYEVRDDYNLNQILESKTSEIVNELFTGIHDLVEAIELLEELTNSFDLDLYFIDTSDIEWHLDSLFTDYIDQECEWLIEWATDEGEVHSKRLEIEKMVKKINDLGLDYKPDMNDFNIEWYDIVMENELRRLMAKDD